MRYCGGQVDFCDIDPQTRLIDLDLLQDKLEKAPEGSYEGIIPVDFAGYPVQMEQLRKIADQYGLWIIEDACHAPGAWFYDSLGQKQYCGSSQYADLAIFSFHPVKHIACGEGGMITTNDPELYAKLKQLRTHGMIYQGNDALIENHGGWYMEMQDLGYNYRMPDILCALGISQLKRASQGIAKRQAIARRYDAAFKNTQVITRTPSDDINHAYHLYIIEVNNRKELYDALRESGIYVQVHYIPVHLMPYYKELGFGKGDYPVAEAYYERCLSIPMYPTLSEEEQTYVIDKVLYYSK